MHLSRYFLHSSYYPLGFSALMNGYKDFKLGTALSFRLGIVFEEEKEETSYFGRNLGEQGVTHMSSV